jgi:hypothetical protein
MYEKKRKPSSSTFCAKGFLKIIDAWDLKCGKFPESGAKIGQEINKKPSLLNFF